MLKIGYPGYSDSISSTTQSFASRNPKPFTQKPSKSVMKLVNQFYSALNKIERQARPPADIELVYDRFVKLKSYKYSEAEFFEQLQRLDRTKDAFIIKENLKAYLNRYYATMNIHYTWKFMRELNAFGGLDNDEEYEIHLNNLSRYVAHYEYYNKTPFTKETEIIAFVNIVKLMSNSYNGRFFVYSRVNEIYDSFVQRLYKMIVAELDSFSHFLQLLNLANVFINANNTKKDLDVKVIVDRLGQKLKAYNNELRAGEIITLLKIHSVESFLSDAEFNRIKQSVTNIIADESNESTSSGLLGIATSLKNVGKTEKNLIGYLKKSNDLLLPNLKDKRGMTKFLRHAEGLLNLNLVSADQINLINRTIIKYAILIDVTNLGTIDNILKSDKVSEEAKETLKVKIREQIQTNIGKYDLQNHLILTMIKIDE